MAQKMMLVPVEDHQRTTQEENGLSIDVIMSAIPKNYRTRAQALLNHITADPQHRLRWNQRGELIYQGQVVHGSHITDLLKNSQRQYKHAPMGLEEFEAALRELNVPTGLMEARPGPPGERLVPQWVII